MKRKLIIAIVSCSMVLGFAGYNYKHVSAEKTNTLTVNDYVTKSNDLSKTIIDKTERMKKLREAYAPRGMTPWAGVYQMAVTPLLSELSSKVNDFNALNTTLTNRLVAYKEITGFWYANEAYNISASNGKLAQSEYDIMKSKKEKGLASENQLSQAKISLNIANSTALQAKNAYDQIVYRMNTQVGAGASEGLQLPVDKIVFVDSGELNGANLTANMIKNHKAMVTSYANVEVYTKIIEVVKRQSKPNIPVDDLTTYYNEELELANLIVEQKKRQLENASYSYVSKLTTLEQQIKLTEENLTLTKSNYDKVLKQFELGQVTQTDVEKARISILNVNLQLVNTKKDYMVASEEYKLFKQGYVPQG